MLPRCDRTVGMDADIIDDPTSLLQQIARGDREAFGRFYDRFATLVFTFAVRLLQVRSDAEDLLQEVFLQVWRQANSYDQRRGSPEAWIITLTRSRGIDKLRSIRRRDRRVIPPEESSRGKGGEGMERSTVEPEARLMVRGALARLPEAQRTVLELAYFEGLTQSEIAARLDEPLGTVKTRMRAGLERLRGLLGTTAAGDL